MDEFYVYVSSEDCQEKFPDNKPEDFIISLPHAVALKGRWRVGLVDIRLRVRKGVRSVEDCFVCCNAVRDSITNGGLINALTRIYNPQGLIEKHFSPVRYNSVVNTHDMEYLHFSIIDRYSKAPLSLINGPVRCTLHFKCEQPPSLL